MPGAHRRSRRGQDHAAPPPVSSRRRRRADRPGCSPARPAPGAGAPDHGHRRRAGRARPRADHRAGRRRGRVSPGRTRDPRTHRARASCSCSTASTKFATSRPASACARGSIARSITGPGAPSWSPAATRRGSARPRWARASSRSRCRDCAATRSPNTCGAGSTRWCVTSLRPSTHAEVIEARAQTQAAALLAVLATPTWRSSTRLREMTANPLMLSTLCLAHYNDTRLPDQRGELVRAHARPLDRGVDPRASGRSGAAPRDRAPGPAAARVRDARARSTRARRRRGRGAGADDRSARCLRCAPSRRPPSASSTSCATSAAS